MVKTPKASDSNSALYYLLQQNQTTPQQNANLMAATQSNRKQTALPADAHSNVYQNCSTGEVTRRKQSPILAPGLMNESMSLISQSRNKFLTKSFQKENRNNSSQITPKDETIDNYGGALSQF